MMLQAVRYCHSHEVCHRDIKLENFVFDHKDIDQAILKLLDFGLSKELKVTEELAGVSVEPDKPTSPKRASSNKRIQVRASGDDRLCVEALTSSVCSLRLPVVPGR